MIDLPPSERRRLHRSPFRNHSSGWLARGDAGTHDVHATKQAGGPISMDVCVAMSAAKTTQSHCSSHQQCQRPFQTKSVRVRPIFQ